MGVSKAKRNSSPKGSAENAVVKAESSVPSSENVSPGALRTLKARQARQAKRELTKGAVEKSSLNAENAMTSIALTMPDGSIQNVDFNKPDPKNGRVPGRKLIRWSPTLDQLLLLHMEYELKRRGIEIPFQSIANRFSGEKKTSGSCIQQHLAKLRIQLLDRGAWVPPLPGRGGNKKDDVRGVVKCIDENGREHERVVQWDEDTSLIFDQLENEISGYRKRKISTVQKSEGEMISADHEVGSATAIARKRRSNKKKNLDVDPSELVSDDDYDPSTTHSQTTVKRKKTKQAVDMDDDDDYSGEEQIQSRGARMMRFEDLEEEHIDRKVVIFKASPKSLAKYPMGISGSGDDWYDPHDTVQAVSPISTEGQGEFGEDVSDNFPDIDSGREYSDGEVDGEPQGDMSLQMLAPPDGFANFDYEANGEPSTEHTTGSNVLQGDIEYQTQLLNGPSAFNAGMNWTGNNLGTNGRIFEDSHTRAFDPNMGIDPTLLSNLPLHPGDLLVNWSDSLSYGNNSLSPFQDDNTNADWNPNLDMNLASNMANVNRLPMNHDDGFMYSYGNPSDNGMLLNIDGTISTRRASINQGHSERAHPSTGNIISGSQTTQPTNSRINYGEFLNEGGQYDWDFSKGGFGLNGSLDIGHRSS